MIKNIFLTILIVYSVILTAQNIELKGVVRDSLQTPLSYVNVIAKPKDVTKNMSFAITDEQGRYRLNLKSKNTYIVSVSHIGYKTVDFVIKPSLKNIQKNIVLLEAKNKLDEVVIELPVTVKGDTTIYNTNKFVNGSECKLKNVLKKLPGVQVD
ncbi:carboxypeptidase-like regulatory domain-containing protein [Tenacibaculum soleae]|uniref:carboxypeptidase-like regulatory domain-containing protein n=1 Tax=Tenacibaculum soleae TaxID=447689 RepID=UPI0026E4147A|nr:carboxypeptidase-like regulatory domain-containing protein [Tenacibaculum soleae]MDO6743121.1 carboxypeptidase-like regulatory domain-containing protein [Tenacibaculum soleae]